jgi:hypothetical protein
MQFIQFLQVNFSDTNTTLFTYTLKSKSLTSVRGKILTLNGIEAEIHVLSIIKEKFSDQVPVVLRFFMVFLSSSWQMLGQNTKLDCTRFLLNPFQFIAHLSFNTI